ncbi:MAG: ABC transporter substrate-binding protein [Cytophagales bacterium]|nr:ABC transporter substrate-binding protein [Cytophaga sp.]
MKKSLLPLLLAAMFMGACSGDKDGKSENAEALVEAKGGKYSGGIFKYNESEFIKNLFPHNITDATSYRIATQVYEGLLKFTQDSLKLTPGLAESFTLDASKTVYTFKLRKGVLFHDNDAFPEGKGRELTAEDVKYCFTLLCTSNPQQNQGFSMFQGILKGADEYYKASTGGVKPAFEVDGIKVIDPLTIQFTLLEPNSIFEYNLARPFTFIFAKEAYEKYGQEMRVKAVGTGPFMISTVDEGSSIILKKNPNYYLKDADGNSLPYLNGISVKFLKDRKTELIEFKKGNFHMMYRLPTDFIIEIEEQSVKKTGEYGMYDLQKNPEMAVHFLSFATQGKMFSDVNLRKAISFGIDRKTILDKVLDGEGDAPGFWGITPVNVFPSYDAKSINGYTFNLDSANYYLKKAGFKSGADVPKIKLELNSDGDRNVNVAIEVKNQLKNNLNIEVEMNVVTTASLIDNMIGGKAEFFRVGWIADYPSPENFLWYLYGKNVPADPTAPSYPNMARYKNPKFDAYYEQGLKAQTEKEAYKYYLEAEKVAMADAPVVVLWYDEAYRLMQPYVKNFPNNPMQYRDFTSVYMVPQPTAAEGK